ENRFGYRCQLPLWSNPPRWVEEAKLTGKEVEYRTLDKNSVLQDRQTRRVQFAKSETQWRKLWENAIGEGVQLPPINFASEMVVAIFGNSSTGGHSIEIDSIIEMPQEVVIDVNNVIPWRCGVTPAVESQHNIIAIPRVGAKAVRVRFTDTYSFCNEDAERRSSDWREPPKVTGLAKNNEFRPLHSFIHPTTSLMPAAYAVPSGAEALNNAWDEWFSFMGDNDRPVSPDIDDENEQVVYVSGGKGASVDVRRVMELYDTLRVDVLATFNQCRTGEPPDTQQIIVVAKNGKRVRFVWEEVHLFCED
ncbi:hypothetical protein KKG16_04825, partial [Patescibacteria group bacterium]|nr:hypothetical protein [Patescibacteria group bacterium]